MTISAFTVRQGAVFDLSANWNAFTDAQIQSLVLPDADKTPFIDVKVPET